MSSTLDNTRTPSGQSAVAGRRTTSNLSTVTSLDLLAGGCLLVLAVVGWAALALADAGAYSLPATLAVSLLVLVLVGLAVARWWRPRVTGDRGGVVIALGCAAVAAALTFPGFSYGVADKDPGGYVSHAVAISHYHDVGFTDPLLATTGKDPSFPVQVASPGARFAGIWVRDASTGLIVPQFYHLWPALLATAYDAFGHAGLVGATPLVGVVATLLMCALLRRVGTAMAGRTAGLVAAGAGGLLLATNMLQVWQARFPTTEILAQALYLGVLLGIVTALQTGWRPAAAFAGLCVGVGWLNRADGLLLVLLSVGLGALLVATRRWNAGATAFALGLAVVTPHALIQAYDLALNYTRVNSIPSLGKLVVIVCGCAVAAVALRFVAGRPLGAVLAALQRRRVQVALGTLVVFGSLLLMAAGFLRPRLFGQTFAYYNGRQIRTYDEAILHRLSWFVTLPGFVVMQLGLMVVALRRWQAALWTVVLPTLLLFTVYGYSAKNSTRLMWWTRRFVPTVLPGIVILVALVIAYLVVTKLRGRALLRVPAVLALAGLVAVFLSQSLPLRRHDEWKGSFETSGQIAALAGNRQGVFLWEANQNCCAGVTQLFAVPVWLQRQQLSALLPNDGTLKLDPGSRDRMITRYAKRFPGQPLFVVADDGDLPVGIDPARVTPEATIKADFPVWDESDVQRPSKAHRVRLVVSVWRVR